MEEFYYNNLYKRREQNESRYNFFNNHMNKLTDHEKNQCNGLLTEYECSIALK